MSDQCSFLQNTHKDKSVLIMHGVFFLLLIYCSYAISTEKDYIFILSQQEVVPTFYNLSALLFCLFTDSLLGINRIIIVKILADDLQFIHAVLVS